MRKKRNILIFLLSAFVNTAVAQEINPYNPDKSEPPLIAGYQLAWHDEFNIAGKPDANYWTYEKGFVRNNELQWYQRDNAECKNGLLIIEGRREKFLNPYYKEDSKDWRLKRKWVTYTSASIKTERLQEFHFGRIIIRARIDTSYGAWPAIWTLGIKNSWPLNGEVDLMEFYRINNVPTILANVAWGKSISGGAEWNTQHYPLSNFTSKDRDWVKKFHTWRMDWTEDTIKLYLDDQIANTTLLKNILNPDGSNPFLNPQYLLLNLAIGSNGGNPEHTVFPIRYEVDYVRYYKKISE